MKNSKLFKILGLSLSVVALASCGPSSGGKDNFIIPKEGHLYSEYFGGKTAKKTYNALLATAITKKLNYLALQDGAVASHWANFVDGLLLQNEYGSLEKQLAESAKAENNYQVFTFKVKSGIPWVRFNGEKYSAIIDGAPVEQYVSAQDFVTSAKTVLSYQNSSETYYLLTNFIDGAMEYYQCTYLDYMVVNGGGTWTQYGNPDKFAKKLNSLIEAATGEPSNVTADELGDIRNFSRVGVKVVEEPTSNGGGTVQYTLKNPAFYFPTLLTYSCYLPVNQYFLDEIKAPNLGASNDNLLYCGPFLLDQSTDVSVVYKKNPYYWNADEVFVDTINYSIFPLDGDYSTARIRYEQGLIDGFSLTSQDAEGWQKYITGEDGSGDIYNPVSPYVNSRDYDIIDYVYGYHINVNRASNQTNGSSARKSYATNAPTENTKGSLEQILNAEKALKLREVRQLVLSSIELGVYSERYTLDESTLGQYMINTYVPTGFVQDNDGNDYTKTHYYKAYQEYMASQGVEMTLEEVDKKIGQGQYEGVNKTLDELTPLREKALEAINIFNAAQTEEDAKIKLPVQLEYFTYWGDEQTKAFDSKLILAMNQRINGLPTVTDFTRDTKGVNFLIIPTYDVNASNTESVSNGGNFDLSTQWGWGPDYGDPMSYLNTFTIHGDWNSIFGYVGDEETITYYIKDGKLQSENLLADYTALVDAADDEYENINDRYELFAQAECKLLNEMAIFQPLTMQGQGRGVSVSKAAGYYSPSGSYGLAKDRLDGLIVLIDPLTGEERKFCTETYEAKKAAYLEEHTAINIY